VEMLETSVLVRYLTDDPPDMAEVAARIIDGDQPVWINSLILAETWFTLGRPYGLAREAIVDLLVALVSRPNIRVLDVEKDDALVALMMCRPSNRVSIADALIWATARRAGASVYTFDRRFPSDRLEVRMLGA